MKNIVLIPARGGSKSIKYKNLYNICGKPLIQWAIEASRNYETFVSTEDKNIATYVETIGAKVINRPIELAQDDTSTEAVIEHFITQYSDFDNLVLIQATSPYILPEDISGSLELMDQYDSIVSVSLLKKFIWDDSCIANYDFKHRPRRQELNSDNFKQYYVENGAIYVMKKNDFLNTKCRLNGKIGLYIMKEYHELDEPEDIPIIENILKRMYYANKGCT